MQVNLHDANTHLSRYFDQDLAGCLRGGRPGPAVDEAHFASSPAAVTGFGHAPPPRDDCRPVPP
jgi:hypothetical protein